MSVRNLTLSLAHKQNRRDPWDQLYRTFSGKLIVIHWRKVYRAVAMKHVMGVKPFRLSER